MSAERRRLAKIATLAVALGLAACATGPAAPAYAPADGAFTGWVRFSDDEFQLYPAQVQVLRPFSRPCLSGAAPRDLMRQARQDLTDAKVTITGRTAPWSGAAAGRIEHAGSVIRNACGGAFVLLADAIRPAN